MLRRFTLLLLSFLGVLTVVGAQSGEVMPPHVTVPLPNPNSIYGIAWRPDSEMFLRYVESFGDFRAAVIESNSGRVVHEFDEELAGGAWTPDGEYLITWGSDVTVHDGRNFNPVHAINIRIRAEGRISPNSHYIFGYSPLSERTLAIHAIDNGELLYSVTELGENATAQWTPDGSRLVVSDDTGTRLYDAARGDLLFQHGIAIMGPISPDGTRFANLENGQVTVHDLQTGAHQITIPLQAGSNQPDCGEDRSRLGWSPGSTRLVASAGNPGEQLWDAQSGQRQRGFENAERLGWGTDPNQLFIVQPAQDRVLIYNTALDRETARFVLDAEGVQWHLVDWSANGRILSFPTTHGQVILFDTQSRRRLGVVPHHVTRVACSINSLPPSISPDGRYAVTYQGGDRTLIHHEVGTQLTVREEVTVHEMPNHEAAAVLVLRPADRPVITVLEVLENDWMRVLLPGDEQGWVNSIQLIPYLPQLQDANGPVMAVWRLGE